MTCCSGTFSGIAVADTVVLIDVVIVEDDDEDNDTEEGGDDNEEEAEEDEDDEDDEDEDCCTFNGSVCLGDGKGFETGLIIEVDNFDDEFISLFVVCSL